MCQLGCGWKFENGESRTSQSPRERPPTTYRQVYTVEKHLENRDSHMLRHLKINYSVS